MNHQDIVEKVAPDCIFCKIVAGQIPSRIIYQTDLSIVIQDIAPQAPIHYLIIPKSHVQDLVACTDADLLVDLMKVPAALAQLSPAHQSFKVVTNNGYAAGQRVFHLHLHFIAGKEF